MKTQMILLTVMALMLGACGKDNKKSSTRINRQSGNALVSGTTTCNPNSYGKIFDNTVDDATFRQRVADFTIRNLDEIGTISGQQNGAGGILFQMTLNFSGGQMAQGSSAMITIADSIALQENGGYIQFKMDAMQGQGAQGQFEAYIGDSKGWMKLRGSRTTDYQGQPVLRGQATYNNFNQGERPLGEFTIGGCAVVGL